MEAKVEVALFKVDKGCVMGFRGRVLPANLIKVD